MAFRNSDINSDTSEFEGRVCNSDDIRNSQNNDLICRTPTFDNYEEVRIAPGDWDECMYLRNFSSCKLINHYIRCKSHIHPILLKLHLLYL